MFGNGYKATLVTEQHDFSDRPLSRPHFLEEDLEVSEMAQEASGVRADMGYNHSDYVDNPEADFFVHYLEGLGPDDPEKSASSNGRKLSLQLLLPMRVVHMSCYMVSSNT